MNLLCGSNISEQNNDTLYQFEEGQRAHTIKFMNSNIKMHTNLNLINNNKIINKKIFDIPKNTVNANITKGILLKNRTPIESNKCSNNTSELEVIEYPINEFKNNDLKNINDIITSQAKDYLNDKTQNDILDYLREKQGLNYLSLFLENDKISNEEENNNNDSSSKSDEIICSYIEVEHNNSNINRMQKEKSVLKKSPNIFSQIHQGSYSDHSLVLKNHNAFNKTIPKNNDESKSNITNNDKKNINGVKHIKNNKIDMKFKKILNHKNNNNHFLKKNRRIDKEVKNNGKMSLDKEKDNSKISCINKSNKKKNILDKKNKLDTFRSIESLNNIIPLNKHYKNLINRKVKKSYGKSEIIQSERTKINNNKINKNLNSISTLNEKDKDKEYNKITQIYKSIKGNSNNYKSKKINSKNKITKNINNTNPLINSININKNKKKYKENVLSLQKSLMNTMKVESKNIIKLENTNKDNSKLKLRKLLINNPNNRRYKCDISMYNINSITNNCKLLIKKGKNKTLNKIMNKSEANKRNNNSNSIQIKGNENKSIRKLLIQTSISKML